MRMVNSEAIGPGYRPMLQDAGFHFTQAAMTCEDTDYENRMIHLHRQAACELMLNIEKRACFQALRILL